MRLLVTRPAPDNARTAAALRALGHEAVLLPLLRVEPIADADLGEGPWDAVLLTSANAARAIAAHPRRDELLALPVLAVGRRTAEAARAAGFADVASAEGDAQALLQAVVQHAAQHGGGHAAAGSPHAAQQRPTLLYPAGEDRAADLEGELAAHDVAVRTTVVYRAVAQTQLPPDFAAALAGGAVDGVLHYSRRSAEAFLAAAAVAGLAVKALPLRNYCLSAAVAAPLQQAGIAAVHVAARPDEAALFEVIGKGEVHD
jgi:uroporphyrinogen-III synthase